MIETINSISVGDILVYCPIDLDSSKHDIGIIYDIETMALTSHAKTKTKIKKFKIFWNRSHMYDVFSETTMLKKMEQTIKSKKYLLLVKHDEK